MSPFPVRNDADLTRALSVIDELWNAAPGTPEAALLDVMSERVHAYERRERERVLPPADPGKLIATKLRELGLSQRELARRLGWGTGRVSEIISGRRALTLAMVRELAPALGIDPGLLVHDVNDLRGEGVWVRVPGALAACAEAAGFGGRAGLEELVSVALASLLVGDVATVVTTAAGGSALRTEIAGVRPPLTLVSSRAA